MTLNFPVWYLTMVLIPLNVFCTKLGAIVGRCHLGNHWLNLQAWTVVPSGDHQVSKCIRDQLKLCFFGCI